MDLRLCSNIKAEDFAESRFTLPDDGRWCELVDGRVLVHSPPSTEHGTVVLNFAKALARYLELNPEGYACFELGLAAVRNPDSAFFPAISYFVGGNRFAELDKVVTDSCPALVLEIASTADRRRVLRRRVAQYFEWGVSVVIVVDPDDRRVVVHLSNQTAIVLKQDSTLACSPDWWLNRPDRPFLEEFELSVSTLFQEPNWARN